MNHENHEEERRNRPGLRLIAVLLVAAAVLFVAPATADAGPYYRSAGDTGIRCTNVGSSRYQYTYNLSSSAQMGSNVIQWGTLRFRRQVIYGGSAGTYRQYYHVGTYTRAARYHVCNRLHTTSSGHYYTYQRVDYLTSYRTKCIQRYGYHAGGIPYTSSWRWSSGC